MEHLVTRDGRLRLWITLRRVGPDEVLTYWTEARKLERWWPEGKEFSPSDSAPGRQLAFNPAAGNISSLPEGQVVVDFERRDEDTLLTVTHGPLALPDDRNVKEPLEAWTRLILRLKDVLNPPH